jgi:enoyl-CoA hydratase/carnithine racemase
VKATVARYQALHPAAADAASWFPDAVADMDTPAWEQLYVNAEHDGRVGVVTLGRETYGWDVDRELNRALDWLVAAGIERVIVTGDFHISTQMVGADTGDFFPALEGVEAGLAITSQWSRTGRRLADDFRVSVAMIPGKRCLGGMLELLAHCHWIVAVDDARLGWPEVTLPVVPGMEGCHWPLRRAPVDARGRVLDMLLTGRPVRASDAVGWLVDWAGPIEGAVGMAWRLASDAEHGLTARPMDDGRIELAVDLDALPPADGPGTEAAREAILACARASAGATLEAALGIQARLAAEFLAGPACRGGAVGAEWAKTTQV